MSRVVNELSVMALLLITCVITGSPQAHAGETPTVKVKRISLAQDDSARQDVGLLRFRGAVEVTSDDESFGGYSGLWVSPDGRRLSAVQNGHWTEARLSYDGDGDLAGFDLISLGPLLDETGRPFVEAMDQDAEALDYDGQRFIVGFETNNRLLAYQDFASPAERIALPAEALEGVPPVAGLSSVAVLPNKSLLSLAEYTSFPGDPPGYVSNPTRAWLMTTDRAGAVWLRASNRWMPVALASFPDGDLLLLELYYLEDAPITRTRISRIAADQIAIGNTLQATEIAELGPPIDAARFEGASVRRGPSGETLIYLISDIADKVRIYMFELVAS